MGSAAEQQSIEEMSLNDALNAHLAWRSRLTNVLNGTSTEQMDLSEVSQDNCCTLGRWIYGAARQKYAHLPEWEALRVAHADFHLCAGEVLKAHQQRNSEAASALLKGPFVQTSQETKDTLVRLYTAAGEYDPWRGLLQFNAGAVKKHMVWYTLAILTSIIFIAESMVRKFLRDLSFPDWYEALLASSFVTLLAFPVMYFQVVRPLMESIKARQRAESDLRVSAVAFETNQCTMVMDADEVILKVNRAYTETMGYNADEVVGHKPQLVETSQQDSAFYDAIRSQVKRVGSWQGELLMRRKSGQVFLVQMAITAVYGKGGEITNYVIAFADLTERKAAEKEINDLAYYDTLTGLPNRRMLMDRLKHAVALTNRNLRQDALLHIDLDNFKTLNDTLGHGKGDLLLQQVATRLRACVRDCDTVARIGGDEFVVVVEGLHRNAEEASGEVEVIAKKILASLSRPYYLADRQFQGSASIGIALFAQHDESVDDLLKRADLAMYQAKSSGRNTWKFFDPQMQYAANSRAALEADLRRAIAERQLEIYFQSQVNSAHQIIGAEALIRWNHPTRGLVLPFEFIPLAEEVGLILPIGQWVLETVCAQIKKWEGSAYANHLELAVNVSPIQFRQPDFVKQVDAALKKNDIRPNQLKIELTESMMFDNIDDTIIKMRKLKEIGVRFSMDDFGTGYSSLSYLTRLPLDQLKIDQSFVRNIDAHTNDAVIVQTIIGMTHNLGMTVIAEGVETEAQCAFLEKNGCLNYQGYLFSRPLPLGDFEKLFAHQS